MIAAKKDGAFVVLDSLQHRIVDTLADIGNRPCVMRTGIVRKMGDFLMTGDMDITAVAHFQSETFKAFLQSGVTDSARPHIDTTPTLTQVHWNPMNTNGSLRFVQHGISFMAGVAHRGGRPDE